MAQLVPVEGNPFESSPASGERQRVVIDTGNIGKREPKLIPVEGNPFAGGEGSDSTMDVLKSAAVGVGQGLIAIPGIVGDASDLLATGSSYLGNKAAEALGFERRELPERSKTLGGYVPNSKDIRDFVERNVTGKFYEPKTRQGEYARTIGELAPAALGGGTLRALLNYAVIPGMASEYVGGLLKGTPYEGAGRVATAVATGGLAGALNRPSNTARAMRGYMAENVDRATIDRAEALIQDARQRGIQLTWPEAIEQVSPGSGLTDLQRVVESSRGGREVMAPVFAERPGQIAASVGPEMNAISPRAVQPYQVGPQIGQAAEGIVGDVTQAINRTTRPLYQASEQQRVGQQVQQALVADPLYAQTLQEIRGNPALNRTIENLPDDSVGVIDLVQRRMREQADNARLPGQANTSNLAAANFEDARNVPLAAADAVTGSRPGVAGTYETARNVQQQLRQQYLEPLMNGPIGALAARDTTTRKAIETLFPSKPLAGSEGEIGQAVSALYRRNAPASRELVRTYIESVFAEATSRLVNGQNQFGAAKFAKVLAGNNQKEANLQAAIGALGPNGDRMWSGVRRWLDIVQATGNRQPQGSKTAFNQMDIKDLASGGPVGNIVKTGASPGKWVTAISDAWSRWQLGNNLGEIARLMVDPNARAMFRQIASMPVSSTSGQILAARIIQLGSAADARRRQSQETPQGTRKPQQ